MCAATQRVQAIKRAARSDTDGSLGDGQWTPLKTIYDKLLQILIYKLPFDGGYYLSASSIIVGTPNSFYSRSFLLNPTFKHRWTRGQFSTIHWGCEFVVGRSCKYWRSEQADAKSYKTDGAIECGTFSHNVSSKSLLLQSITHIKPLTASRHGRSKGGEAGFLKRRVIKFSRHNWGRWKASSQSDESKRGDKWFFHFTSSFCILGSVRCSDGQKIIQQNSKRCSKKHRAKRAGSCNI